MEMPPEQYTATADSLAVYNLPAADPFELTISTIINPQANTQLMGLYRTGGIYCTQCEAEGFRRITYFPDRPDVLAPYTVQHHRRQGRQSASAFATATSSAAPAMAKASISRPWFDPHPKPSYLFALVAGDLGVNRGHASRRCPAARSPSKIYVRARQGAARSLCHGRAEAIA